MFDYSVHVPFSSVLKNEYRDFMESVGSAAGSSFTPFQNSIATIPISIAACESGFSKNEHCVQFTAFYFVNAA